VPVGVRLAGTGASSVLALDLGDPWTHTAP
jgi:hypothetical protein